MTRRTLACLLLLPGFAAAQTETPQVVAPPPLSGPQVTEERIDGVESGFSSMTAPGRIAEAVPTAVFRRAVAELAGEQAPEGARLSDEQRQRLGAIEREHAQAVAAFRRQHAEEFRQLREALGQQLADRIDPQPQRARRASQRDGAEGDRPGRGQPQRRPRPGDRGEPGEADSEPMQPPQRPISRDDLTDAQRAAIARLRELRAQAPGPEAVQTRVWAELTELQRAHVQTRIDEHRARMADQRQAAYVERMTARRDAADARPDAAAGDPPPARADVQAAARLSQELRQTLESLPPPMQARLAQLPPERLERLLDRLSRLTPEERAQALRRLQQARERQGDRRGGDRRDRSSPPPLERVKVPDPGDK